ncbi:MAG: ShlB/FhaC/HecB family hemolysin secretion/activation protein [Altererythrobacter sp.]|nr:ShlB/FhaC/HecB family hemolysin secretion/activation protein [Altererythrobacter sp.]
MELMVGQFRVRVPASHAALALALIGGAVPAAAQEVSASAESAAPAARFDIRAFQVRGNTVLSPQVVERAVYPHMGPGRTEADVEAARAALQQAFEDAGYVAVSVFLPEQSVDGGILQLEVQQQTIGQVLVEGSSNPDAVRAAAPSLTPGTTPNLPAFQRDVIALNQTASRRVNPEMRAGVAPGTLDVVLTVEERSPIHASAELNNFSSAATSDLRAAVTLRHDNLWGLGHSLSLSAQTAPRRSDDGTVFSGNYLLPLRQGTQLLGYYVHSDSDIAVVGGTSVIGQGDIAGLRLIQSLGSREGFYHALTLGFDYKSFGEDLILGADTDSAPITYVPATLSWRGDWTGASARSDLSLSATLGIRGLGDGPEAFRYKRLYSRDGFFVLKLDAGRVQDFGPGLQLSSRFTGQWSPDPLISNEGFSLGGMSTVRGYYESEAIGDHGFALQTELRTPDLAARLGGGLLNELRLHAFLDSGWAGLQRALPGQDDSFSLVSTGLGARLKLFDFFTGALDVGVPLISGPDSQSGDIFVRFRLQGEF